MYCKPFDVLCQYFYLKRDVFIRNLQPLLPSPVLTRKMVRLMFRGSTDGRKEKEQKKVGRERACARANFSRDM